MITFVAFPAPRRERSCYAAGAVGIWSLHLYRDCPGTQKSKSKHIQAHNYHKCVASNNVLFLQKTGVLVCLPECYKRGQSSHSSQISSLQSHIYKYSHKINKDHCKLFIYNPHFKKKAYDFCDHFENISSLV